MKGSGRVDITLPISIMDFSKLIELANNSGGTLYIMAFLFFVALVVIVERTIHLLHMQKSGQGIIDQLKPEAGLNQKALVDLLHKEADLPHTRLFNACRVFNQTHASEQIEGFLEEAFMHEVPQLDRSLWMLDTVITLAPLLGLFGTIVGMFQAFSILGDVQNNQMQVTGGIAEALVATACGLFIAMIGLLFFNWLTTRVRMIVHQLETIKIMLVNRHELQETSNLI